MGPVISSGAWTSAWRAAASISRALIISWRLLAITDGQPPGNISPNPSIAAGIVSHGLGSKVPFQSKSSRKRDLSVRVSLAPFEMASGLIRPCRSRLTYRKAEPLGAQTHLCRLPT